MGVYSRWTHAQAGLGVASSSQIISSIRKGHTMDFTNMTPEEIYELMKQLEEEMRVRQNRAAIEQEANQVILDARENGAATKPPLKWEPVHIDKAFALGETTRKDGTTYVSAITNNVCIPGECKTGWHEVDDDDTGEQ